MLLLEEQLSCRSSQEIAIDRGLKPIQLLAEAVKGQIHIWGAKLR